MRLAFLIVLMLFCIGCERGDYFDTGAVLVDKALLPESIEVKDERLR